MQPQILYGYLYTDEENGDRRMVIYEGIINTRNYPVVRHLGNVNITQRFFLKFRKFPRKIENIENNTILLNDNKQLRPIQDILLELGYQQDFIDLVRNIVNNSSNDKKVMTHEHFQDYRLDYDAFEGEADILKSLGKVSF
jgi:hypothetical protein